MFKTLTTSHDIKRIVRKDKLFSLCYQINPRPYAKVYAKVSAGSLKNGRIEPFRFQTADPLNTLVLEILRELLSNERDKL
jgi:hypothetical protein